MTSDDIIENSFSSSAFLLSKLYSNRKFWHLICDQEIKALEKNADSISISIYVPDEG